MYWDTDEWDTDIICESWYSNGEPLWGGVGWVGKVCHYFGPKKCLLACGRSSNIGSECFWISQSTNFVVMIVNNWAFHFTNCDCKARIRKKKYLSPRTSTADFAVSRMSVIAPAK